MIGIDMIIQFGMSSDTSLLRRIISVFNTIVGCSRLIIQLTFFSSIRIQITTCQHHTQFIVKEAVTV